MIKRLFWLAALVPLIGLLGCATSPIPSQPQIVRFNPIVVEPQVKSFINKGETYSGYESDNYDVAAALFEYQSILLLPLEITNKTDRDIKPEEYSVSLRDGRDLKKITLLSRAEIVAIKAKMDGSSSGGGLESQVIAGAYTTVLSLTSIFSKNDVKRGLELAAGNYFSFRPIYKHEKRQGILCFLLDFRAEYPIALELKVQDEIIKLKFMPKPSK